MADTTRISDLTEAAAPTTDMNFVVDSGASGTKRMPVTTFVDSTLSVANKAADARATGLALAEKANADTVPTKVSDLTNDSNFQTLTQVETAINGKIDNTLSTSGKAADAKKTGDEITSLKEDLTETDAKQKLLNDNVPGTVQSYTFTDGSVSKVEHKSGATVIRSDVFTYTDFAITETRTLNTGDKLVIETNLSTLETTVTYTAA